MIAFKIVCHVFYYNSMYSVNAKNSKGIYIHYSRELINCKYQHANQHRYINSH